MKQEDRKIARLARNQKGCNVNYFAEERKEQINYDISITFVFLMEISGSKHCFKERENWKINTLQTWNICVTVVLAYGWN